MATDRPAGQGSHQNRQPHAVLDLESRQWKALKIEQLLDLDQRPGPLRLLEVGTGSGGIAHYFASHPSGRFQVDAVDVLDNRLVHERYTFSLVTDTTLPFDDASFDVVLSNHVIEHVGGNELQCHHLLELRRVLRPGGIGYLAVPNRWMLVEPHYHLIFLSWLPRRWRSPYLRALRGSAIYDCEPLQQGEVERLLHAGGLGFENVCIEALRATFDIERRGSPSARILERVPDFLIAPFRRLIPTLIYRFWRDNEVLAPPLNEVTDAR